jgi:hypothetical protein
MDRPRSAKLDKASIVSRIDGDTDGERRAPELIARHRSEPFEKCTPQTSPMHKELQHRAQCQSRCKFHPATRTIDAQTAPDEVSNVVSIATRPFFVTFELRDAFKCAQLCNSLQQALHNCRLGATRHLRARRLKERLTSR